MSIRNNRSDSFPQPRKSLWLPEVSLTPVSWQRDRDKTSAAVSVKTVSYRGIWLNVKGLGRHTSSKSETDGRKEYKRQKNGTLCRPHSEIILSNAVSVLGVSTEKRENDLKLSSPLALRKA